MSGFYLTVVEPFGDWQRGSHISDPEVIARVVRTHPHHVVQHSPPHPDFHRTDAEIKRRGQPANMLDTSNLLSTSTSDGDRGNGGEEN